MKTLSFAEIKEKLYPWGQRNLPPEDQKWIGDDDELVDKCNFVAREMNKLGKGELNQERYNNDTTDGETNYELSGDILEIYLFLYKDASSYKDQRWTWVNDVIVLKEEPDGAIEMDIRYLRDITEITNEDTDEVDLPREALDGFITLLKQMILRDLGIISAQQYDDELDRIITDVHSSIPAMAMRDTKIFRHTMTLQVDDQLYDITDQRVSQDSVTVDVDGDYIFL